MGLTDIKGLPPKKNKQTNKTKQNRALNLYHCHFTAARFVSLWFYDLWVQCIKAANTCKFPAGRAKIVADRNMYIKKKKKNVGRHDVNIFTDNDIWAPIFFFFLFRKILCTKESEIRYLYTAESTVDFFNCNTDCQHSELMPKTHLNWERTQDRQQCAGHFMLAHYVTNMHLTHTGQTAMCRARHARSLCYQDAPNA